MFAAGQRRNQGKWPHLRELLCKRSSAGDCEAAAAGDGNSRQVRRADQYQWRWSFGPGRRGQVGDRAGAFGIQYRIARQAQRSGPADARRARARTQEVRAEGRPQALPVLEALTMFWPRMDAYERVSARRLSTPAPQIPTWTVAWARNQT